MIGMESTANIKAISKQFLPDTEINDITPFGNGHINKTFLVRTADNERKYILQQINIYVFSDISRLMQNIELITDYIKDNTSGYTLSLLPSSDGSKYYRDENFLYWRMYNFVPGTVTYETADKEKAFEGGKAFADFQLLLEGFPLSKLKPIIPNFHNLSLRMVDFINSIQHNFENRKEIAQPEISSIIEFSDEMLAYNNKLRVLNYPQRVTHNDTKLNNVLFDKNNKAICVIDLDTVMPGYITSDFGDSIRSFCNTSAEDEKNLDKVKFSLEIFYEYAKGFLGTMGTKLSALEKRELPFSPLYITYMQAVRFLTDYLNGDKYYNVNYHVHNLIRARVQLKLLKQMRKDFTQIEYIVRKY